MNETLTVLTAIGTTIPTTLATLWVTGWYVSKQTLKEELRLRNDTFTNCPSFSFTIGQPGCVKVNPFWLTISEDSTIEHPGFPGSLLIAWKDGKIGADQVLLTLNSLAVAKRHHQWMVFEILTREDKVVLLLEALEACSSEEHYLFQPRPKVKVKRKRELPSPK
jgi:hypothetical protein